MSFVHLHTFSDYSILQSTISIKKLVARAQEFQMSAVALTDKNNLFAAMEFVEAIEKLPLLANGGKLKPIIGLELSVKGFLGNQENYPLVLLAENNQGYHNLIKLNNLAYRNSFTNPAVSYDDIFKWQKDIIFLSGGTSGELAVLLYENKSEEVKKYLDMVKSNFSKDCFFLEIQNHNDQQEKIIFDQVVKLARGNNLPLVATNQVCYLEANDSNSYEVLLAIKDKKNLAEQDLLENKHSRLWGSGYYFKSIEEMKNAFIGLEEGIENTTKIANRCNVQIVDKKLHMPAYTRTRGEKKNGKEILKEITHRKLAEKGLTSSKYIERLNYELKIITEMEFSDYFLIVADFVDYAKKNNILVGVGRGSAAGSLISYVLGITGVDPIKYGLLFERFLNPERRSLPDIDIDFQEDKRNQIVAYIKQKYGEDNVAQIITFGKLKAKAILKDTARVFGMSFEDANLLSSFLTSKLSERELSEKASRSLLQYHFEENINLVSRLNQDSKLQTIYENSLKLENLTRQTGIHAAGLVIADKAIGEYIPLFKNEDNIFLTQFEGQLLESKCGLVKMDILGLKTLTILSECLENIEKIHQKEIDIKTIPLDDKKTFALYSKGLTAGIFQFESGGMINYLKELAPNRFEDLIAMNALYRPGPMSWIPIYIAKKNKLELKFDNEQNKKNYHELNNLCLKYPFLNSILAPTNQIPIFQEQIMEISKEFAGFSLGEADNLRKAMGKKDKKLIDTTKKLFIAGAEKKNYSKNDAVFLYDKIIEPFGGYGFNKSHSVSYSLLSFQTAFLKANYSVSFMTALLNSEIGSGTGKIKTYIKEAQILGLEILSVDINSSSVKFYNNKRCIVFGLSALKNIGVNLAQTIVRERGKNGPYKNIGDFIYRNNHDKVNKQAVESLVKAGAFDELGLASEMIMPHLSELIERIEKSKSSESKGQGSFFEQEETGSGVVFLDILEKMEKAPNDYRQAKENEKEILGFNLKHHLFAHFNPNFFKDRTTIDLFNQSKWRSWNNYQIAGVLEKLKVFTTKDNKEMAILTLNNGENEVEVVCFNKLWDKEVKNNYTLEDPVLLQVKVREDKFRQEKQYSLALEKMELIKKEDFDDNVEVELVKEVVLVIKQDKISDDYLRSLKEFFKNHRGATPINLLIQEDERKQKVITGERIKISDSFKLTAFREYDVDDFKLID